jgi:hypothetical protein
MGQEKEGKESVPPLKTVVIMVAMVSKHQSFELIKALIVGEIEPEDSRIGGQRCCQVAHSVSAKLIAAQRER